MTALVATVTPTRGWISQDTWVSACGPSVVEGMRDVVSGSAPDILAHPDPSRPTPALLGETTKLRALSEQKAIAGGVGILWDYECFIAAVEQAGCRDIVEIQARAVELRRATGQDAPLLVIVIGWSDAHNRIIGFACNSAKDFVPEPVTGGHSMTPPLWTQDEGYAAIERQWTLAAAGIGTASFHRAVVTSMARASRAGRYPISGVIGGSMHTATVTRDGVEVRQVGALEG